MGYRRSTIAANEFYHIYNRGADKRTIFQDGADYRRFMELLFLSNSSLPVDIRRVRESRMSAYDFETDKSLVAVGAYCLMPNHFHLLLTSLEENGIQSFMRKLATGYSMYFNKRYTRTGVLFQGRFKSEHVDTDEYLKYLFSYIHLNPVKLMQGDWKETGIRNFDAAIAHLENYTYSSFMDYAESNFNKREEGKILTPEKFPEYFPNTDTFKKEILEWIQFNPRSPN